MLTLALVAVYGCQQHDGFDHQLKDKEAFFEYTGSNMCLAGIVTMMEQKNDSCEYVSTYSDTYGVPLWDESVWLPYDDYSLTVVPVLHKGDEEFQTVWVFRQKGYAVDYYTYSKKNELSRYTGHYWAFDYFTQKVLHKTPESGLTIQDNPETRMFMHEECVLTQMTYSVNQNTHEVTILDVDFKCWDVLGHRVGAAEDDDNRNGTGGGGSGTSPTNDGSTSTSAMKKAIKETFENYEQLSDTDKQRVDTMYKQITKDCVGQALLKKLSLLSDQNKLKISFTNDKGKFVFSGSKNTLTISRVSTTNEMFHELFHAYQSSKYTASDWNKRLGNLEVEAHLAQFLYIVSVKEPTKGWSYKNKKNARLGAIANLSKFVTKIGQPIKNQEEEAKKRLKKTFAEFKDHSVYGTFAFVDKMTFDYNFPNLATLAKNC